MGYSRIILSSGVRKGGFRCFVPGSGAVVQHYPEVSARDNDSVLVAGMDCP